MKAVLLDLDGVLYVEEAPVEGALKAVERLQAGSYAVRFVTNTTAHSRDRTLAKLERLGFSVADADLITPAALALRYCHDQGYGRVALVMNEEVKRDFRGLNEVSEAAQAVIVGDLGTSFGYDVLNHAFRCVVDGAELIALQKNRYWLRADGLSLDVGPFVAALEYAAGTQAHVVGKPAHGFFDQILRDVGVRAEEATMVGDDIESDIGGALGAGMQAILVRTGKYREDRVRASGVKPTQVVDSIADVPALLAR